PRRLALDRRPGQGRRRRPGGAGPGGGRAPAGGGCGRAAARGRAGGGGVSGRVYLVGAGPGDPGLLTTRALELIATADVIVHDRLIPSEALEHARPGAELIYAGKQGGGESVSQREIERVLIDRGRHPERTVVRL